MQAAPVSPRGNACDERAYGSDPLLLPAQQVGRRGKYGGRVIPEPLNRPLVRLDQGSLRCATTSISSPIRRPASSKPRSHNPPACHQKRSPHQVLVAIVHHQSCGDAYRLQCCSGPCRVCTAVARDDATFKSCVRQWFQIVTHGLTLHADKRDAPPSTFARYTRAFSKKGSSMVRCTACPRRQAQRGWRAVGRGWSPAGYAGGNSRWRQKSAGQPMIRQIGQRPLIIRIIAMPGDVEYS